MLLEARLMNLHTHASRNKAPQASLADWKIKDAAIPALHAKLAQLPQAKVTGLELSGSGCFFFMDYTSDDGIRQYDISSSEVKPDGSVTFFVMTCKPDILFQSANGETVSRSSLCWAPDTVISSEFTEQQVIALFQKNLAAALDIPAGQRLSF